MGQTQPALIRCMGRCNHLPGTCTATNKEYQAESVSKTPSPNPESIGDDVVERAAAAIRLAEWAEGHKPPPNEWENLAAEDHDVAEAYRAMARAALSTLPADKGLREALEKVREYISPIRGLLPVSQALGFIDTALNSTHGVESRD